jgi:hypothetical protein
MRRFPNVVHRRRVRASSRHGTKPALMVLHSTEGTNVRGISDLVGLGSFFSRVEADSTVAVDSEGQSARYKLDVDKPWTQAWWNPPALSIEMIGRASQRSWTDAEVDEAARWLAYWSRKFHLPLQRGRVDNATGRIIRRGVVTHKQLGARGGGHVDPGDGFPVNRCIARARVFRAAQAR